MPTIDEAGRCSTRRRDAWLREDLEAYLDCWTDDMTFESPVHRPPICGREAYAALIRASAAAVRPVRFDVAEPGGSRTTSCSRNGRSRRSIARAAAGCAGAA